MGGLSSGVRLLLAPAQSCQTGDAESEKGEGARLGDRLLNQCKRRLQSVNVSAARTDKADARA